MSLSDLLTVIGGSLELGGVLAVALDIRLTRQEVRRYEKRPQTIRVGPGIETSEALGIAAVLGGQEPSLEQRVRNLENRVDSLATEVAESKSQITRRLREEFAEAAKRVEMDARDRFEVLDTLLRGVTKGGIRLRVIGVVLVVAGIVATAAGSLVSPA